jgi:glyoxylase-like metal-dependent hydrolase (beta-lactamase superfamily II)
MFLPGKTSALFSVALGFAAIAWSASAAPGMVGPPPADAVVTLETRQLLPDLYVLIGAGGNTVVRKTPAGTLIVDTKYQGKNVYDAMRQSLKAIGADNVEYVLLSHFHLDHSGNTGAFKADGATIVGQAKVASLMPLLQPKATDVPAPAAPDITFDQRYSLSFGGTEIRGFNFGPGHTSGDAVYYFPKLKVVTTGDLAVTVITPNIDYPGGGSMTGLQHVLHEIAKLDFELCIPGHRDQMMTKVQFLDFTRRWDLFVDRARKLVRAGVPRNQFYKQLKSDDLGFDFTTFGWPDRVDAIYAELGKA